MPRAKDARAEKALELYRQGLKLIEIAKELDVAEGTVRSWKNRYAWDTGNAALQKKKRNVAKEGHAKKGEQAEYEVDSVIQNTELTDKQRLFCLYYIRCFNATKAYQKAYGRNYATSAVNGSNLLKNPKVKAEILKLKQEKLNREFLSESDIFQKYMDIAFSDMTDFLKWGTEEVAVMGKDGPVVDKDGNVMMQTINKVHFKDSNDIDGTIVSEVKQGRNGVSIKLSDSMRALQWLSDHMDMATEKQKAEIAMLKAKADAGKDDREQKLDRFFEQIEGALRDVE